MTPVVLVVDLDGTLLRSDMLHECFWSAIGRDWRNLTALLALRQGRAALKQRLATLSAVDVSTLPYDATVLARIRAWRDAGGQTALVTASDHSLARAIGDHLGLFDMVQGSQEGLNLKGHRKTAYLDSRFGPKAYAYMGDAAADLPVWAGADQVITLNASPALRRKVSQITPTPEHLTSALPRWPAILAALRLHQWLKNLLVFLPVLMAHRLDAQTLLVASQAFICFCLVASSVYVLNDLLDLSADRAHPRKRQRPFASGHLPIGYGPWLILGLLGLGGGLAAWIGWRFLLVMACYALLTTLYSLHLKRRIALDICVLAGLYTMRIIAGGIATGITLSVWLLAFAIFLFLSLAAVKRQAELIDTTDRGEVLTPGRGYETGDLPIISMIALSAGYISVLVLMLYVNGPSVLTLYAHPEALWGICAVLLYWVTRLVMITQRGQMLDDPVIYATKDRASRICLLLILGLALIARGLIP